MKEGDIVQTPDGQGTVNQVGADGELTVVLDDGTVDVYDESEVY